MPFGLKLRRTKRYNVLSKNYFVTRIRLLDNNVIECTLSVESTGQECLEAVAQRLELRETHYFGLWFHSKTQVPRWVELEKPLKKQLDKFGNEPLLFFGVMFYVPSICRLEQEATRTDHTVQSFLFPSSCVKGAVCKHLELRLEEECLFTEYEQIPKKRAECNLTTAMMPENAERNRFRDVVPYEENRVELVPNKENNTGYINASHIKMMIRGEEWHYIATQGPLPNTSHDFWQMVWEQGVNVIAMVTAEEEGGRSKSHRYWPKLGSKHNSATHGKFKVTTKFRTDSGCYATTGLKVKHLLSGQERTVWHLQYTDWPEHGCPEYVQGFLSYLEEIQSVRRHTNSMLDTSKSPNPPVVVHCSAGVGRTGVVILTELMISCLEHNERVEVPVMLGRLRQQRMLMVQTVSQYKFVYQVLIQFLKSSRLI
ncbi:hypothetical protein AOLI_G00039670 [Acnodon oligacanthus]